MRAHSDGRNCYVERFDYGFQTAISVETRRIPRNKAITYIPLMTPIPWEDSIDQMLHMMGFKNSDYRTTTQEDAIKFAVEFTKRIVRDDT